MGRHIYFNGSFNLDQWDPMAEYAVFDDFEDWSRWFTYKQWMGAHKEFVASDKYRCKKQIKWGKPCIILSNGNPYFKDQAWIDLNCYTEFINKPLY